MARSYSGGNLTGTVVNSSTLPFATLISAATIRPKIYELIVSNVTNAPVDGVVEFQLQRCTTTGTAGSNPTPFALDPGDPASLATVGLLTFSVGPTLTANAFLLTFAHNTRATVRWVAAPTKELILPATASNGVAVMTPAGSAPASELLQLFWEE